MKTINYKNILKQQSKIGLLVLGLVLGATVNGVAQLNPFQSVYYQNQYLINPAMAGMNEGLVVNLGYRQQWSSFPGTPVTKNLTAEIRSSDRVGLGLNISNDKAGLLQATRVMATYAYHLPLNGKDQKLNFGLSLGINDPYISNNSINGDQTDVQIADYNQLQAYVDGDFGIAYTSNHITVEGALPNLKTVFFKNQDDRIDVDRNTFMAAAAYKFFLQNDMTLEPKVMLRGVKGFKDIFDAGVNFKMNNYGLSFQGIYHSSQNIGFGLALDQRYFGFIAGYNLETGPINTYTSGTFEFGLKVKLFKK